MISAKNTKDKPPRYGLYPPYAVVCFFPRQTGRPDNGNHLESGEVRGNMRVVLSDKKAKNFSPSSDILDLIYSRFVQFMGVLCNGV